MQNLLDSSLLSHKGARSPYLCAELPVNLLLKVRDCLIVPPRWPMIVCCVDRWPKCRSTHIDDTLGCSNDPTWFAPFATRLSLHLEAT